MSFYDILKAAKVGGNLPSYYETLFARKLPCSKYAWQETTLSGVPPLTFSAKGSPLTSYSITGNMTQTGTPTPAQPIVPEECGDLVTTGEHAGEYEIPITVGGTTSPIYLSEPLRKIGDYADSVDSSGTVTRRIRKLVLDGTEDVDVQTVNSYGIVNFRYAVDFLTGRQPSEGNAFCSHFELQTSNISQEENEGFRCIESNRMYLRVKESRCGTAPALQSWLAAQYANGTPVCVWYVLASPVTETVTCPTITPASGSNTLSVGTTLAPSGVSITGKIKEV